MPDTLGPVEVEFTIPADFGRDADAAIKKMAGLTAISTEGPKKAKAALLEQKEVIKQITRDIAELEKKLKAVPEGKLKSELTGDLKAAKQALEEEKATLTQRDQAVEQAVEGNRRLNYQLRDMVDQLAKMKIAGLESTDAYKKLEAAAAKLRQQLNEVRDVNKALSNDQQAVKGMAEGVTALTGAFSAGAGVVGLFAGENENLAKIQTKVQSLMAITIGLQQVANVLDKESAFMTVTVARAKELWAKAEKALTVALWGSNVAAKALMSTLTLGLAVAIPVLIGMYDKWSSKQKEAKEAQDKLIKATAEVNSKAAETRLELDMMINRLEKFKGTKQDEARMLKEVNDKYGDTFGTYKTLAQWLDVLKGKAADYVQVMLLQAQIDQKKNNYMGFSNEIQAAKLKPAQDYLTSEDKRSAVKTGGTAQTGYGVSTDMNLLAKIANERKNEYIAMLQETQQEIKDQMIAWQTEIDKLVNKNDFNPPPPGKTDKPEKPDKKGAPTYEDQLAEVKRYFEVYNKAVEIGAAESAEYLKTKLPEGFKSWQDYVKNELENNKEDMEKVMVLMPQIEPADDAFAKLLEKYKTYATKIKELTEKGNKEIAELRAKGKNAEADNAQRVLDKEVLKQKEEALKESDAFGALWENAGELTKQQLDNLIATARAKMEELKATLDPKDVKILDGVIAELQKQSNKLTPKKEGANNDNPFAILSSSIKEYKNALAKGDHAAKLKAIEAGFDAAGAAAQSLVNSANQAVDIMADLGVLSQEEAANTKETLNQVSGVVQGGLTLAKGIMTGNPVDIIAGGLQVIGNMVKLLDVKGKEIAKRQAQLKADIADMERQYRKLADAVNEALGTDVYARQAEQVKLNINEIAKYQELIDLENRKKRKKRNQEDINAWKDAIYELQKSNDDIANSITESMAQTNARDFAGQLADSITGAWQSGEDAASAYEKVTNNILANAVKNALKMRILEQPLNELVNRFADQMRDGTLTKAEQDEFRDKVATLGKQFNSALTEYGDIFNEEAAQASGRQGAFKAMGQDTASELLGQFTALRMSNALISDLTRDNNIAIASVRSSLQQIAENTHYCRKLEGMERDLKSIVNDGIKLR